MRLLIILFVFLPFFVCVMCKNHVKSLTESLGQEVIEIGAPIKELPQGLEEEPSAENDDEDKSTSTTVLPATKKDFKKLSTMTTAPKLRAKGSDKIDGNSQEDDEARIEKELAEIYKDNADYKGDSAEVTSEGNVTETSVVDDKPIARQRENFKFQPDVNNNAEIERFRTSIDDISCDKQSVTKKLVMEQDLESSASRITINLLFVVLVFNLIIIHC